MWLKFTIYGYNWMEIKCFSKIFQICIEVKIMKIMVDKNKTFIIFYIYIIQRFSLRYMDA